MRKPIALQVVKLSDVEDPYIVAICDDGSVWWTLSTGKFSWNEDHPIPGTQRAMSSETPNEEEE